MLSTVQVGEMCHISNSDMAHVDSMEDNHCVIKDIWPSNQLIEKVPMTSNCLFPLRIMPYMKGTENSGAAFKA